MSTTAAAPARVPGSTDDLIALCKDAAAIANALKRSPTVTAEVYDFVKSLHDRLETDITAVLDKGHEKRLLLSALAAATALNIDDPKKRRIELRMALDEMLGTLDDLVDVAPLGSAVPIEDVLARTAAAVSAPQAKFAELLGISTRTLQRWLSGQAEPSPEDADRARTVAELVAQLNHTFTPSGVIAWFHRTDPRLGRRPIELLADPLRRAELISVATSARSMPV